MPKAPSRFHVGNCGAHVHPSPTIGRNISPTRDALRRETDRKNMFHPVGLALRIETRHWHIV
jgi:hypothetical protein